VTRDDIIRMAREAGLYVGANISGVQLVGGHLNGSLLVHMTVDELEDFAALVAAAEREVILKMLEAEWFKSQANVEQAIRARGETK